MKTALLLAALSLPFFSAININFDSVKLGELPPDWTPVAAHHPAASQWTITRDPNAPSRPNVLAHQPHAGPERSLCLFDKVTCVDGDVSVKLKILSGRNTQDAGLVFRAADSDNYYLVRASAREHTLAMFRVKDGRLEPIPLKGLRPGRIGIFHPIKIGNWDLMRVTYKGNQTTVYFNHRKAFEAYDDGLSAPGRAGLWTRGDTAAYFDDFRIDKKK